VLGKYAWGPVLSGLQGRERFIRESLESAKRNRDESVAKLAEYEARLAGARDEVDAIMAEARRDAEALRQREEQRARTEAETLLDRARREIEIAKDTAVKELYQRATVLATDAASRIIRRELRPEDNERLVAESVAALEQQLGGGRPAGRG
jgi:F-type H+-transporting ATPase subunit b